MSKKCVLLLSGGLDSATTLAIAKAQNYQIYALSFSYGQRHDVELEYAKKLAESLKVTDHKIINIDLRAFGGSALTDDIEVPKNRDIDDSIPVTYVPARNTIFLSFALAYAETLDIFDIFIGANIVDYSGYPDCRPEYMEAFEKLANLATAAGVQGEGKYKIHRPLIDLSKGEIIQKGMELDLDYALTISCYDPNEDTTACQKCDACLLRIKGFVENALPPILDKQGQLIDLIDIDTKII